MLRVLAATALALVLGATVVAVPGASARPYTPKVVEFDLGGAARPAGVAANRGFVSPPLRTPKRFNLVGLSWRGRAEPAIALRARKQDGAWTRWTPATGEDHHGPEVGRRERSGARHTSEPVWVGEADFVQYRMSRSVPGLRLHFVNTTGTATPADRRASRARRVARPAARRAAPAQAIVRQPRIRTRAEWGASRCPTRRVSYGSVRAAVVHHTVTANLYTRAQVPAAILAVCRFHRNTNGWNDIGYNFVVDRFGRIWEGRAGGMDEAVVGSHAQGYNSQTTGISNLGTFTSVPQTDAAIGAMARLIRWKLGAHGVPTHGRAALTSAGGASARYRYGQTRRFRRVIGHRDTGRTACPGTQLYYQLPELRKRIGERLPPGSPVQLLAEFPPLVTYTPQRSTLTGQLLDANAYPIAGAPVELQRLVRVGWRTISSGTTDAEGRFSAQARPKYHTVLRWRFAGDSTWRPFRGDGAAIQVAPRMTLRSSTTRAATQETVELDGTILPRKRSKLTLVVERSQEGVWRPVARKQLTPRDGTFFARRSFRQPGSYRMSVLFPGDLRNAPALSPYVELTVEDPLLPFR